MKKKRRNNRLVGVGVAAIVAISLVGVSISGAFTGGKDLTAEPAHAAQSDGLTTVAFDPRKDALPAEAVCTTNSFVDHSLRAVAPGDKSQLQFSTAVSIPFTGTDDAAVTKEILAENCGNPTFLEMNVKEMLLWTDKDVPGAEANKDWLNEINEGMQANGLDAYVKHLADDSGKVQESIVTEEYQLYASWMNTVLLRFNEEGKQSPTSTRNWELPAVRDPSKGIPSVQQAKDQESKPAWVRVLTDKNDKCLVKIGFNDADRRIELFNCVEPEAPKPAPVTPETPKVTPPKTTTPPKVTPPPTKPPTTEPPTVTPPPTKPPTTVPKKPEKDPAAQGNAPTGGGKNADPGPGEYKKPAEMEKPKETPRENPAPPVKTPDKAPSQKPTPSNPKPAPAVPDPTPAPAPQKEAPTEDKPETICEPKPEFGIFC